MPTKQTSLMEHGVATIAFAQQSSPGRDLNPRELRAIIVKLEPVTYGRCSLCNRWAMLHFCLEYFDSKGDLVMWGEVCQNCAAIAEKQRVE